MSERQDLMGGGAIGAAAPKRTMSPEHKAKMAEGRARAKMSRGRPATRHEHAPMPAERAAPESARSMINPADDLEGFIDSLGDGSMLTRESRRGGQDTTFDVPKQGRRPGWDYQWWPTHVIGQEVDPSAFVRIQNGGWVPVPASHFPQLCPVGWARRTIDREGQRLFMRPERLTQEALAEQNQQAYEQKANRLAAAQTGDVGREFARRVNPDGSPASSIVSDIRPLM